MLGMRKNRTGLRPGTGAMGTRVNASLDSLWRMAYRVGHPVRRLCLCVAGASTRGAQVAVWHGGKVLLIRNSYRDSYTFPGGYRRAGEPAAVTASRELGEETGISVAGHELDYAFAWSYTFGRLAGHDDIYECCLAQPPTVTIDNREVVEARFCDPRSGLQLALEDHVRDYLARSLTKPVDGSI